MAKSLSFWTTYDTDYIGVTPADADLGESNHREAYRTDDMSEQFRAFFDGARIAIDHAVTPMHGWDIRFTGNFVSHDFLLTGWNEDYLLSGHGHDLVSVEAGNDVIDGGTGDDFLLGGTGDDPIWGGEGDDVIHGDGVLQAFYESNLGFGWVNASTLHVFEGVSGQDGMVEVADRLRAKELTTRGGNDELHGGAGDNRLFGHAGQDTLTNMGGGNDQLSGGADADLFLLYRAVGTVEIMDFEAGLDVIDLRQLGYANEADALSHVTSIANGDVTFSDGAFNLTVGSASSLDFADSLMI